MAKDLTCPQMSGTWGRWSGVARALVALASLLFLWDLAARYYDPRGLLFPSPLVTFQTLWRESSVWWPHAMVTYSEMAWSVLIALLISIPIAFAMLSQVFVRHGIQTLFLTFQCLPLFVLAPVMVMLFGWSQLNILLPSTLMVLFPLSMTLFKGVEAVPDGYVELFRSHNVGLWTTFWKLRLPFATGHLLAGLRVGVATAGMAVAAAEFSGAQRGLGVLLQQSRRDFDLPMAFVCIVALAAGISCLHLLVVLAERLFLPWRRHVATHP